MCTQLVDSYMRQGFWGSVVLGQEDLKAKTARVGTSWLMVDHQEMLAEGWLYWNEGRTKARYL